MSGEITRVPEQLWVVEYTPQVQRSWDQRVNRSELRIYGRNADVAKAVVDGTATGPIYRYVTAGTDSGADWGDTLRATAAQWTDPKAKRAAVSSVLKSAEPILPSTPTTPSEIEEFLS